MLRTMWKKLQGMPDLPMKLGLLALYVIGAVYVGTQQEAWHTLARALLCRCWTPATERT